MPHDRHRRSRQGLDRQREKKKRSPPKVWKKFKAGPLKLPAQMKRRQLKVAASRRGADRTAAGKSNIDQEEAVEFPLHVKKEIDLQALRPMERKALRKQWEAKQKRLANPFTGHGGEAIEVGVARAKVKYEKLERQRQAEAEGLSTFYDTCAIDETLAAGIERLNKRQAKLDKEILLKLRGKLMPLGGQLQEVFQSYDFEGDGRISLAEAKAALKGQDFGLSEWEVDRVANYVNNANQGGHIEYGNFMNILKQPDDHDRSNTKTAQQRERVLPKEPEKAPAAAAVKKSRSLPELARDKRRRRHRRRKRRANPRHQSAAQFWQAAAMMGVRSVPLGRYAYTDRHDTSGCVQFPASSPGAISEAERLGYKGGKDGAQRRERKAALEREEHHRREKGARLRFFNEGFVARARRRMEREAQRDQANILRLQVQREKYLSPIKAQSEYDTKANARRKGKRVYARGELKEGINAQAGTFKQTIGQKDYDEAMHAYDHRTGNNHWRRTFGLKLKGPGSRKPVRVDPKKRFHTAENKLLRELKLRTKNIHKRRAVQAQPLAEYIPQGMDPKYLRGDPNGWNVFGERQDLND